jgi:hypothetical protein
VAIASLIIGVVLILSIFSALFLPIGRAIPIRLIGILGLVLAILAFKKKARRRIAIAGIVLNSLAILCFITQLLLLATGA